MKDYACLVEGSIPYQLHRTGAITATPRRKKVGCVLSIYTVFAKVLLMSMSLIWRVMKFPLTCSRKGMMLCWRALLASPQLTPVFLWAMYASGIVLALFYVATVFAEASTIYARMW